MINEENLYDVAIIGAGINGCALAYELHKKGQNVIVLDKQGIAKGGSGAAGAFINPKITKSGPLKELIEEAYLYALPFYTKHFLEHTTIAPLLHISKYENDNEKVHYFKEHTSLALGETPISLQKKLSPYSLAFSSVYLKNNAVVEAVDICKAMLEGIDFLQEEIKQPVLDNELWYLANIKAKKIVLCTGAYNEIFKQDYISLRRIYGQRCEVTSSTIMSDSIHHEVSVSVTKKNGRISIGASHFLKSEDIPTDEEGAKALLFLAQKSIKLDNLRVENVFTGMRSGSNDYLPLLGDLVDLEQSLKDDNSALKGNKQAGLSLIPNVSMINGVGGYGFVLAPLLAKMMSEHLVDGKDLPEYLQPKRFYYRYTKKKGNTK